MDSHYSRGSCSTLGSTFCSFGLFYDFQGEEHESPFLCITCSWASASPGEPIKHVPATLVQWIWVWARSSALLSNPPNNSDARIPWRYRVTHVCPWNLLSSSGCRAPGSHWFLWTLLASASPGVGFKDEVNLGWETIFSLFYKNLWEVVTTTPRRP